VKIIPSCGLVDTCNSLLERSLPKSRLTAPITPEEIRIREVHGQLCLLRPQRGVGTILGRADDTAGGEEEVDGHLGVETPVLAVVEAKDGSELSRRKVCHLLRVSVDRNTRRQDDTDLGIRQFLLCKTMERPELRTPGQNVRRDVRIEPVVLCDLSACISTASEDQDGLVAVLEGESLEDRVRLNDLVFCNLLDRSDSSRMRW
jgi:hypothetical protein